MKAKRCPTRKARVRKVHVPRTSRRYSAARTLSSPGWCIGLLAEGGRVEYLPLWKQCLRLLPLTPTLESHRLRIAGHRGRCYPGVMRVRHPLLLGFLPLLILLVGSLVWSVPRWVSLTRHVHCSQRIIKKIRSLEERRSATVSPRLWEECVGWAVTAHCNVCFSEEHASYEAMCRFEEQLDERLKEEIDLGTIEWIGDRLAETGPHGQQYMANWREQWKALQESGKREKRPEGK